MTPMQKNSSAGLEGIAVFIPPHFLDLDQLARSRGVDPNKYAVGLGCRRMVVPGPNEDAVTMAGEAAAGLIESYDVDLDSIGLLIVGSESGVDGAKPMASLVHH